MWLTEGIIVREPCAIEDEELASDPLTLHIIGPHGSDRRVPLFFNLTHIGFLEGGGIVREHYALIKLRVGILPGGSCVGWRAKVDIGILLNSLHKNSSSNVSRRRLANIVRGEWDREFSSGMELEWLLP